MTTNRPLAPGIIDRIEGFLIDYEETLLSEGNGTDEACRAVDEMEARIHEEMDSHPISRTSLPDLEEMLARLYPGEEKKVTPLFESPPSPASPPESWASPPALLFAMAWGACFLLMLGLMMLPSGILEEENPGVFQKFLVNIIVTLGILAPVGVTALGLLAVRQIEFNRGSVQVEKVAYGLTLLFPTLLFLGGTWFLGRWVFGRAMGDMESVWISFLLALFLSYHWIKLQIRLIEAWLNHLFGSRRDSPSD